MIQVCCQVLPLSREAAWRQRQDFGVTRSHTPTHVTGLPSSSSSEMGSSSREILPTAWRDFALLLEPVAELHQQLLVVAQAEAVAQQLVGAFRGRLLVEAAAAVDHI